MPAPMARMALSKSKRLVVKVGTGTLTDRGGRFDRENCNRLAAELAEAARGRRLVVVTSGAVALGAERLHFARPKGRPWDIATKQACAAVGQPHLVAAWGAALHAHGLEVAQVLLTADDLASRKRFLNARRTFARLLDAGVVPVVNENDTVAVEEIIGDNDTLAGLVASCVEADLVAMLTDVEGLYDRDPREAGAVLLRDVARVTAEVERIAGGAGTERSVGGMATKVKAARRLATQGVPTALLSGRRPRALSALLAGEPVGTVFAPAVRRLDARRGWLSRRHRRRPGAAVRARPGGLRGRGGSPDRRAKDLRDRARARVPVPGRGRPPERPRAPRPVTSGGGGRAGERAKARPGVSRAARGTAAASCPREAEGSEWPPGAIVRV